MGIVKEDYLSTNPPLYRYISILDKNKKYIKPDKIDIIKGRKISLSNPNNFNDIFECKAIVNGSNDQKKNLIYGIENILEQRINHNELMKNIIKLEGYRICCFTSDKYNDNHHELLWAHYASQNYGLCIVYDMDKVWHFVNNNKINNTYKLFYADGSAERMVDCDWCIMGEIDYSGNQAITFSDGNRRNKSFSIYDFIFKKSSVWAYEQEIRLAYHSDYFKEEFNYYIKIEPECIREIRFGYCLNDQFCNQILELYQTGNNSIKFYKMDIDDSELKLVPKEYKTWC